VQDLEMLAQSLWRSISAGRYKEAQQLADRCVALDLDGNHEMLLTILERARRLAIAQRSLASARLANIESAARYDSGTDDQKRYIAKG
jgi:hypothetical protein